ncbi:CBS domain-containing protein [Pontiella sp.]|uniref:CBS domain-containing protein n=1 Tax=Pontiella sp. TaxID=2837462 RepID=UPI00356807C5
MSIVSNLLDSKGHDVLTVKPDQPLHDVVDLMSNRSAGTALVMDEGEVKGILSERDVFRKVVLPRVNVDDVTVGDVMSKTLTTVTPDTTLEECMQIMTDERIRHLPVLRDKQLRGIISIGDVVKYLLLEKDFKIRNLETYISGSKDDEASK